jgi:hypothetical protein
VVDVGAMSSSRIDLTGAQVPKVLYHYTTQQGFLGILGSRELWASKIHFLNDSAEYKLGLRIAGSYLDQRTRNAVDTQEREQLEILGEELHTVARANVFVFSLTEEGDLLSQWRAYGGKGGFSLGFDSAQLTNTPADVPLKLFPCLYAAENQQRAVEALVDGVMKSAFSTEGAKPHPTEPRMLVVQRPGRLFGENLAELASVLKDESFEEEKEWRLISDPISVRNERVAFRQGQSFLVPYFRIPLSFEAERNPIVRIVVGPTAEADLAAEAARMLVTSRGLTDVEVVNSRIPLRNW